MNERQVSGACVLSTVTRRPSRRADVFAGAIARASMKACKAMEVWSAWQLIGSAARNGFSTRGRMAPAKKSAAVEGLRVPIPCTRGLDPALCKITVCPRPPSVVLSEPQTTRDARLPGYSPNTTALSTIRLNYPDRQIGEDFHVRVLFAMARRLFAGNIANGDIRLPDGFPEMGGHGRKLD